MRSFYFSHWQPWLQILNHATKMPHNAAIALQGKEKKRVLLFYRACCEKAQEPMERRLQ